MLTSSGYLTTPRRVDRLAPRMLAISNHQGHQAQGGLVYTVPFNTALDGNTVEMSVEQARYGKAAAQYQATLRFIEGNISGVRKALRGD